LKKLPLSGCHGLYTVAPVIHLACNALVTFAARSWRPAATRAKIPSISVAHIITPAPTDDAAEIQTLPSNNFSLKKFKPL
jgi:hypothetical protein